MRPAPDLKSLKHQPCQQASPECLLSARLCPERLKTNKGVIPAFGFPSSKESPKVCH